jgi:hypothetical protein
MSALDAFTNNLTENYPLDIHADSVQITDDVVTAHFSIRDTSIPQGNQGNQGNPGNKVNQAPASQGYRRGEHGSRRRNEASYPRQLPTNDPNESVSSVHRTLA